MIFHKKELKWSIGAMLLGGTAAIALVVAPVDFTTFDLSLAEAAGAGERGNGGGNSDGKGGGGHNSVDSDRNGGGSHSSVDSDRKSGGSRSGGTSSKGNESRGDGGSRSERSDDRKGTDSGPVHSSPGKTIYVAPRATPSKKSPSAGGASLAPRRGSPVVTAGDDDSDRPPHAGVPGGKDGAGGGAPPTSGDTKGDLFGDLYVILRNDLGLPILLQLPDGSYAVQPIDADGNTLELDEDGHVVAEDLPYAIEVDPGRLNVGRAPLSVLENRISEVEALLSSADAIGTDPAGRLELTSYGADGLPDTDDDSVKTIDSPLENLAIYLDLMTKGSIGELTIDDLAGTDWDFLADGALTPEDLDAAVAFFAGAADKTGEVTADVKAYLDAFLGIETEWNELLDPNPYQEDVAYSAIDYTSFTYDRFDKYGDVTAVVLVKDGDAWVEKTVSVYDEVFDTNDDGVGETFEGSGTLVAYAQAVDDARAVIEFIHEYAVPVEDLGDVSH